MMTSLRKSANERAIRTHAKGLTVTGLLTACLITTSMVQRAGAQRLDNPILYVTQVPVSETKNTVVSIGGSHLATTGAAPRGGDLMMRYPDGDLKNLTREAGFGQEGRYQNTSKAIAVRDPAVHWSGSRALFSMVVGGPVDERDDTEFFWQIYEVTGLNKNQTPVITRVQGQAADYNNIQPAYTSSDLKIVFVSDTPLDKRRNLYPVRDEQSNGHAVTGLWQLNRADLTTSLMEHSPSGSFKPFVDSFGRIVFSRWDHLQRDETASNYDLAFDFLSEKVGAETAPWKDVFPEPVYDVGKMRGHQFDLFLPWTINQDGTDLLTMNHLGRHELGTSAKRARADANLRDFKATEQVEASIASKTRAASFLQISEKAGDPGHYVATDAVLSAVSAGRLVGFKAAPDANPDDVDVTLVNNVGLARDPSYLQDGRLMGTISIEPAAPAIRGTYGSRPVGPAPVEFHEIPPKEQPFKIRVTKTNRTTSLNHGTQLIRTNMFFRTNFLEGEAETYFGQMWELQPVEVVSRNVPAPKTVPLPSLESQVFRDSGVSIAAMKAWLKEKDLALLVSRNLTARDANDKQQPYNLYVPGGASSIVDTGPRYEITNLQFFQGDYVRGYLNSFGRVDDEVGRRVAARLPLALG